MCVYHDIVDLIMVLLSGKYSLQMDLHAELTARLGISSAAPITTATGEGSEFESSIAPSESVSAVGGEKHGKKKRKKKKHKSKGLTEDDFNETPSKSKGLYPITV